MAIADALRAVKIIHEETYSNIFVASTNMDKMRVLLGALNTNKAKSAFYNSLKDNDPFLFEDLKPEGERESWMHTTHTRQNPTGTESISDQMFILLFVVYLFCAYYVNAACTKFFD